MNDDPFWKNLLWFVAMLAGFALLQILTDGGWDRWTDRIFGT